jgi:hypothetical protein
MGWMTDEAVMRAVAETQDADFNDETEAGVKALARQIVDCCGS